MEFVPGEDLRQPAEARTPARRRIAWSSLLSGIAGGVDSAHKSGILHRDLKPENILLPESGTGPKVVDFGVAKLTTAPGGERRHLTTSGTIVGTPAYMAPEQLRGEAVDGRADVFSLGVMTYEMLTGKLPYGGGSFFDIGMKQAAGDRPGRHRGRDGGDGGGHPPRDRVRPGQRGPSSPRDFAEELRGQKHN